MTSGVIIALIICGTIIIICAMSTFANLYAAKKASKIGRRIISEVTDKKECSTPEDYFKPF